MSKNTTQSKHYILGPVNLGKNLSKKNREVTKYLSAANERIKTIPNPIIMFNQIILMESKGSSEIENIITTNDELYKEVINKSPKENNASKTLRIKAAVKTIANIIDKNKSILTRDIIKQGCIINGHQAGFRPTPGTKLVDGSTNETIHTPPQSKEQVLKHMNELIKYINEGGENDPITDAMLIHHAFEWIHPFIDGNGRTGRIIIGAYLKLWKEIDHIFLPLSYFINKKRTLYYQALAAMTSNQDYEFYLDKMFDFMIEAAKFTINFAREYDKNRNIVREMLLNEFGKYYNQEFIDVLFYNAYTTPKILETYSKLNYRTIVKIISFLQKKDIFTIKKEGKRTYYINQLIIKEEQNG